MVLLSSNALIIWGWWIVIQYADYYILIHYFITLCQSNASQLLLTFCNTTKLSASFVYIHMHLWWRYLMEFVHKCSLSQCIYTSWPLDCPLSTAGRYVPLLCCQKSADSTFKPTNLTVDLALHQTVFVLLTPIAIEPEILELDPSLVMLDLVGWAKQVAKRVNTIADEQYSLLWL